jgi:spore coat polysaccharide biosynthesis protein SpsF
MAHIIQRALSAAGSPDDVVLATSQCPENDPLAESAKPFGIKIYRGDEHDVLSRFTNIINEQQFDHVVRLTGDNPLIDPQIIRQTISEHLKEAVDYTHTDGLPQGMNVEIIRSSALLRCAQETTNPSHREHVTSHILLHSDYSKHTLRYSFSLAENLRLTVDYPSDYALVCEIVAELGAQNPLFGLEDIIRLIQRRPWLRLINTDNWQVKDYATWEEERSDAVDILRKLGMKLAADLINKSPSP